MKTFDAFRRHFAGSFPNVWGPLLATAVPLAPIDAAKPAESEEVPRLEPAECVSDELDDVAAECHTCHRQENWDDPNGWIIEIPVAVIEPEDGAVRETPLVFFPGGPGFSPLAQAEMIDQLRANAGDHRIAGPDGAAGDRRRGRRRLL